MQDVFLDFETYYDDDFSLSKMQTDAYVLDERFESIMVVVKINGVQTNILGTDDEIKQQLHDLTDWSNARVVCHNTLFDGFIMTQRYGIKPRMWMCTLKLIRMLYPHLKSYSLANLAKFFGTKQKGTYIHNMKGVRRADMTPEMLQSYLVYCGDDTDICEEIFYMNIDKAPLLHTLLIDMTIRMFTEPAFVGDIDLMRELYKKEVERKAGLMALAAIDRTEIMSNEKFAMRLRAEGVIPPTKLSPKTGKTAYAFAKTDKQFTALLEHDNPDVQALVAARVGAKTTIAETRAARFIEMTERGPLPVYLNFWGAKTTGRYSGGNKVNWQNLPARGPSAGLRYALKAPPGYKVVVGDSSNIELRTVMALAGEREALEQLRAGIDMYSAFATRMFGREISKADVKERFLGKTAMLGLQYGAGATRFKDMVETQGKPLGVPPIDDQKAYQTVELYRSTYRQVQNLWYHCDRVILPDIAGKADHRHVDTNGWFITQGEGFGRPGEPGIIYHNLRYDHERHEWIYDLGRMIGKHIYGAKLVENLCQHAAMLIVMWQTARIHQRYPVHLVVHDEAVCVVKEEEAEACKAYMEECLSKTPAWCENKIPVVGEVDIGNSYGDAK